MNQQLTKALESTDQLQKLGMLLVDAAFGVFERAGCPNDFCIQDIGRCAVFGGTNRLIWSPGRSFYPDRSYCTPKFLEYWDRNNQPD